MTCNMSGQEVGSIETLLADMAFVKPSIFVSLEVCSWQSGLESKK